MPNFVDPQGCDLRTSVGSQATSRDTRLMDGILNRDEHRCVVTGYGTGAKVERAHLIPHARGSGVCIIITGLDSSHPIL